MRPESILRRIYDPASRANPYPLFAELRKAPVSWQEDGPNEVGTYVVSTYREIAGILHDPRLSSDLRKGALTGGARFPTEPFQFISLDPPEHDRLRALAMGISGRRSGPSTSSSSALRSSASPPRSSTSYATSDALTSSRASPRRFR